MSQRGLTRDERKAQTREAIMGAATRLFARDGIEATSIDRIAQEIGLTKGAVYSAFDSKQELVEAVAEASSLVVDIDVLYRSDLSLRERLRLLAQELVRVRKKVTKELLFLDLEMFLYAQRHPSLGVELTHDLRAFASAEGAKLEAAADERGEPLPIPGADLIVAIMALTRGIAQELSRNPGCLSDESIEKLFGSLASESPKGNG